MEQKLIKKIVLNCHTAHLQQEFRCLFNFHDYKVNTDIACIDHLNMDFLQNQENHELLHWF